MSKRWTRLCILGAVVLVAGSCVPDTGNQLPVAVASGTPSSGPAPLTVAFSSVGSNDPDGVIAGYVWTFGDGSPVSTVPNPSHTYAADGTYTATLVVTDNGGATGSATVTVTVGTANLPPNAVAGADVTDGDAPLDVQFDGSSSDDPDGTVVAYDWEFGDGSSTSTDESPLHTYTTPGSYVALLTVTDNEGATNTDSVAITVGEPPVGVPPTAVLNVDGNSGRVPLEVEFDTTNSLDPDGTIVSRSVDFGDATPASSDPTGVHTYTAVGTYVMTLTVVDDDGNSDTDTQTISVEPNQAPTAAAQASPTSGTSPVTVSFTSTGSSDADGSIVGYAWAFGDGATGSGASTSHTYVSGGTFVATLTVTDDSGATSTASVTVTVVGPVVSPTSAPGGSTIAVTIPCEPLSGHPPVATAIAALVTAPGGSVVATGSFDNSATGDPNAIVLLNVPPGATPGSYEVRSSCDLYMSTVTYGAVPFTVT